MYFLVSALFALSTLVFKGDFNIDQSLLEWIEVRMLSPSPQFVADDNLILVYGNWSTG